MRDKKKHLGLFLVIFFISLLLTSCKPKPSACTAGKSARTEGCDEFKRVNSTVLKGLATVSSLPPFSKSGWHPIKSGEAVSTNNSGMAELNFSGCWPGRLFCFRDSSLNFKVATCGQVTYQQNPAACIPNGSIYTNGPCPGEYTINTGSARVKKTGTVLSITYLPDRRDVTLVVVLEGSVDVEPVMVVDPLQLGSPDNVDGGMFYFTMPDNQLSPVGGLQPRQTYPIPELPPVVAELDIWEWMFDVSNQADQDGILPGNWPPELSGQGEGPEPPQPDNQILVNRGGVPLADPLVQEAMLRAVNWPEVAGASGLDNTQITGFVGEDPIDLLRDAPHDPDFSRELLAEAGYPDGVGLTIFYPPEEPEMARMAKNMLPFLRESSFVGGMEEIPVDFDILLAELEEAGDGFIILSRE